MVLDGMGGWMVINTLIIIIEIACYSDLPQFGHPSIHSLTRGPMMAAAVIRETRISPESPRHDLIGQ